MLRSAMVTSSSTAAAATASSSNNPPLSSPPRIFRGRTAPEDSLSDYGSIGAMSSDGQYEVIEYDLQHFHGSTHLGAAAAAADAAAGDSPSNNNSNNNNDNGNDLFQELGAVSIQEDSPAAEALRANAEIQVSSLGKAARAVHMQTVRRALKRAALKGRSNRKGKPPRVPYGHRPDGEEADVEEDYVYSSGAEDEDVCSVPSVVKGPLSEIDEEQRSGHDDDDGEEGGDTSGKEDVGDEEEEDDATAPSKDHPETPKRIIPGTPEHPADMSHIPDGVAPGTVEAGKKVLGSVDPHDLLKLVRWRRKKKGALAKFKQKSYVKGKVIDGEHELYTLSIAVMIGVRTSISRTNTEINGKGPGKRWVRPSDFRTTEKYEFRPKGDGPLPPHQLAHTFKFKDYSPVVFAYLRRLSGVNEFDFLLSVCGNANFIEFISNAKSGQFFFYSSDGRYMIKTMTNAESKFLRRILPAYFKHCCENPNTMITRFFGMYRVKLYHLRRNVKFVIMNSVYYTDKHLQTFYDLKGSSVGRDAKPGQAVLKDNDLRRGLPENALALRPKQRLDVRHQLEADSDFMRDHNIMDYSMLVGVHHVPAFEGRQSAMTVGFRKAKAGAAGGNRSRRNTGSSQTSMGAADEVDAATELAGGSSRGTPGGHNRSRSDTLGTYVFENGLEDDDNSYLPGSENRPYTTPSFNEETERKKQATIEKLFWPFHHMFDIHGHRRLKPMRCPTCGEAPCGCVDEEQAKLLKGYNIPKFVAPLSDRKDGGFEMDTTGLHLPLKLRGAAGGELIFEGKIFYMGIIDILQEYNSRKVFESRYRSFTAASRLSASCVPPRDYGERFLAFFDQFTKRADAKGDKKEEEGIEIAPSD